MVIRKRNGESKRIISSGPIKKDVKAIGCGTFGKISSFIGEKGKKFAIKTFIYSENPIHLTTLREIKALMSIKSHFVIKICEIKIEDYKINMIMPFYENDLYKLIGVENLAMFEIKHIFKQILMGLMDIHQSGYLHRDIKSSNILIKKTKLKEMKKDNVNGNQIDESSIEFISPDLFKEPFSSYKVKICDFGMARTRASEMTPAVVTLWYRSPEILLGSTNYTKSADIWSCGCILLEMFNKKPIFKCDLEVDALNLISDLCGPINSNSMPGCQNLPYFEKYNLNEGKNSIGIKFEQYSLDAVDLANKMLNLDPNRRPSVQECLNHPFFTKTANSGP
jgi:serine/threonine protein kinase